MAKGFSHRSFVIPSAMSSTDKTNMKILKTAQASKQASKQASIAFHSNRPIVHTRRVLATIVGTVQVNTDLASLAIAKGAKYCRNWNTENVFPHD
jgi:hypothetical protein